MIKMITHAADMRKATPLVIEFIRARLRVCALSAVIAMSTFSTSPTRAQLVSPDPHGIAQEQFTCHLPGTSDRQIGIYRPDGSQHCRVDYTRDGTTRSLWSSGHDYHFCVRKALEIVGLLESVDFACTPRATIADGPGAIR
jgi:hypothetical protein